MQRAKIAGRSMAASFLLNAFSRRKSEINCTLNTHKQVHSARPA
jgi:hypothetical protein